jgi:phage baseplate assembly protein W
MANLLDRFNKNVIGSESKIADYRSIISSGGDFRRIEDIEVILSSWNNILLTPRRTYMFDPQYGSNLYKMVFEPADERTQSQIVNEVVDTIRKYDDRARINNVRVLFSTNKKGFNISIDVEYEGNTGQLELVVDEDVYFRFYDSEPEEEV